MGPCREETELVMCTVVEQALAAANIKPSQVRIMHA